jgi:nucleoid DNA-binding protein
MNTTDLINKLALNHDITSGRAEMILSIVVERLTENLKKEGEVHISNFGILRLDSRKTQPSTYMKLSEPITVSRNFIAFEPDKFFLDKVNSGE